MHDSKSNPLVDGIPLDIEQYLNDENYSNIVSNLQNDAQEHVNPYLSRNEQKVLDILIRRRNFERQERRTKFKNVTEFRQYVIDVWLNQIGFPSRTFPGFVKACQELGIPYYRG